MEIILKFVGSVINFAIFLAMIGGLKQATLYLTQEVAKQQKQGLVSLTDLNYQLMGNKKYCQNISWKEDRCKKKLQLKSPSKF